MGIKHHTQTIKSDDPNADVSKDEWNENHDVTSGTATITTGSTYVDVAHGLDATPDINKITPTPKDNLGGRSYWISDVGGTYFRININGMDLEENHSFGYIIV